jgi:hypothetical protein
MMSDVRSIFFSGSEQEIRFPHIRNFVVAFKKRWSRFFAEVLIKICSDNPLPL